MPAIILQDYHETTLKKIDISLSFLELGTKLINNGGKAGFISSSQWMSTDYGLSARVYFRGSLISEIIDFGSLAVFDDASTYPAIFIFGRESEALSYINVETLSEISLDILERLQPTRRKLSLLGENSWILRDNLDLRVRLANQNSRTKALSTFGKFYYGIITRSDHVFVVSQNTIEEYELEDDILFSYAYRGEEIERYGLVTPTAKIIYPYVPGKNNETVLISPSDFAEKYPNVFAYLRQYKTELMQRRDSRRAYANENNWYCHVRPGNFNLITPEKFAIRGVDKESTIGLLSKNSAFSGANTPALILEDDYHIQKNHLLAILNSSLISRYLAQVCPPKLNNYSRFNTNNLNEIPIRVICFTTTTDKRKRLMQDTMGAYDIGDHAGVLQHVQAHIDSDKMDVVHDLLVHLAHRMIDLNKQKQEEVKRFLSWLEKRLKIQANNDGSSGIDSLTGKTILVGYLGNYQKGEGELPWREFHYRLYQNRNRFAISLSDVEGEIQREYEKSLETLIPIKRDLARTDALIDKIVYRLYGLTDEEIELIERPQYEQALADAKAQVVADDKIKDDEEKIEKIAEGILPAAKRFFERVEPKSIEVMLDSELPNWRSLPPDAPTFLLTGDYNLHTLPEHMDFSSSVIPYTKAVETVLYERIFAPFRDGSGYAEADCSNEFLKDFMRGKKKLTLGNFMIILRSSRETALQTFISRTYPDAAQRVFGAKGLVATLNDEGMLDIRNKAAHDEVLSRDEAQQTRVWAMQILEQV